MSQPTTPTGERGTEDSSQASPWISRLPREVLEPIFLDCIDYENDVELLQEELISLASVCRLWRDVVYTTPALWRKVLFSSWDDFLPGGQYERMLALFDRRSHSTLTHARISGDLEAASYRAQLEILGRSVDSLLELDVHIEKDDDLESTFGDEIPSLESAHANEGTLQDALMDTLQLISRACNLSHLQWKAQRKAVDYLGHTSLRRRPWHTPPCHVLG